MSDEKGYYNPTDGYWQANARPTDEILASYRTGTIEVPLKPTEHHQYIFGEWVHVEPTAEEIRAKMPKLTARQFRLGLLTGGYTPSQVTNVIEAMPDNGRKETARIEWEYATTFSRTHPIITTIAVGLGLTDSQVDVLWTAALTV